MRGVLEDEEAQEQEDPDDIDEVPEQTRVLDPVGEPALVLVPQLGAGAPEIGVDDHPADHVEGVEPGHREVDRQEGVGRGVQVVVQLGRVLEVLDDQEDQAEQHRQPHVQPERSEAVAHQRGPGHDHRDRRGDPARGLQSTDGYSSLLPRRVPEAISE